MGAYEKLVQQLISEAEQGMHKAAEQLLADANESVPVVSGELKASGKVIKSNGEVSVVYDAEHALSVHENPDSIGYKWLERTTDMNRSKYEEIIAGGGK